MTGMSDTVELERSLAQLTSIGLDELADASLMNRVDSKYLLRAALLPDLLNDLAPRYRVLEVEGLRVSPYCSLYFDTPARDCYLQHHNGRAQRYKYRQRCYEASGISFFEVKQRTNRGRTVKRRVPISGLAPQLEPEALALAERVTGRPLQLASQIWTNFSRITLVKNDLSERATFDTDLVFRSELHEFRLRGLVIGEVKQAEDNRQSPLRQYLRDAHVRPLRMSKYCLGSALLDPTLKHNRFKRKLNLLRPSID